MANILMLSNGHGEDLSGSLLARALMAMGHHVHALPLAGLGRPYLQADVPLLGPQTRRPANLLRDRDTARRDDAALAEVRDERCVRGELAACRRTAAVSVWPFRKPDFFRT